MHYKYKIFYSAFIIICIYVLFSVQHLMNTHFFAPDADRICMDGVFLLDFIKDLPSSLFNIYDYTTEYYAKYPSLSIGYRPIFFPVVVSFFYLLFGISYLSAKMAVFCFLFIGVYFWIKLVTKIYDFDTAILSTLLWLTNPFIYNFSQLTVLEIPTLSMCIVCMYCLYKYESHPTLFHGLLLGIIVGFTLWINQKSWFILLVLLLYPAVKGNIKLYILKNTWLTVSVILIYLIPLIILTLWLGDQNISQSVGHLGEEVNFFSKFKPFHNLYFLYHDHLSFPLLVLIFIGISSCIINKDSKCLLFGLPVFCIYLFFTLIRIKLPRFPMYWIPFFCLFASVPLQNIYCNNIDSQKSKWVPVKYGVYGMVILFQISFLPDVRIGYAKGYEKAVQYVLEKTRSPVIFFQGYANGQFIFFARKNDTDRQLVILRGCKIITSSSISAKNKLKIHLHTKQDIYESLKDLSVHFIVIESRDSTGIPVFKEFENLLNDTSRFKLHKAIQVESNYRRLKHQELLIYENLNYAGINKDKVLKLRLPIVGKTINLKFKKLLTE